MSKDINRHITVEAIHATNKNVNTGSGLITGM